MDEKRLCPRCKQEISLNETHCEDCGYTFPNNDNQEVILIEQNPREKKDFVSEETKDHSSENLTEHLLENYTHDQRIINYNIISENSKKRTELSELDKKKIELEKRAKELDKLAFNIQDMPKKCNELLKNNYRLFGLFGFDQSGKSAFLYSLQKEVIDGNNFSLKGYTCTGEIWQQLKKTLEFSLEHNIPYSTPKQKVFIFPVKNNSSGPNLAFLDIAGEEFAKIQDWNKSYYNFFGLYLSYCSGFIIFLDLIRGIKLGEKHIHQDALSDSKNQSHSIENFLSVASFSPKLKRSIDSFNKQKEAYLNLINNQKDKLSEIEIKKSQSNRLSKAPIQIDTQDEEIQVKIDSIKKQLDNIKKNEQDVIEKNLKMIDKKSGPKKVNVPVVICLSKADVIDKCKIDLKGIPPRKITHNISPWLFLKQLAKARFEFFFEKIPKLKIEWLSSLGLDFEENRKTGDPLGIESIVDFIINPLPGWSLSTKTYMKINKIMKWGKVDI